MSARKRLVWLDFGVQKAYAGVRVGVSARARRSFGFPSFQYSQMRGVVLRGGSECSFLDGFERGGRCGGLMEVGARVCERVWGLRGDPF